MDNSQSERANERASLADKTTAATDDGVQNLKIGGDRIPTGWLAGETAENILDSIGDPFFALDQNWRFVYLNRPTETLFQRSANTLVGKNIWEEFPDAADSAFHDEFHRAMERRAAIKFVEFSERLDAWLEVSVFPRENGLSVYVRDVSVRVRAQEALREQSEALQTIIETGRVLSAELDLQKLVQTLTDAATELCDAQFGAFFYNVLDERGASYMLYTISGVPREAFSSFPMPRATALFGPTFRNEGVVRIANVGEDVRFGKNAPYFGMPAGHLPVVSYLAVPVVSRSGEVLGGLFFGHEKAGVFTERAERIVVGLAAQAAIAIDNARLFEDVKKSHAEAETANRMKDEFLATVSHELRTPLNSILGWANLLRAGGLAADAQNRAVEIIERNARAQEQIIEDILDVSRIITGKLRLELVPLNLIEIIEAAVESLKPTLETKNLKLRISLEPDVGVIFGDAQRLQQIVWNLLSNAIKFTSKNGEIRVSLGSVDSHVEIAVSDTGKGIAPEFLPHVFDRFRQADSSTTRSYAGLGLGLAIVRHLVELHGGTVGATSAGENQGATFTVRLPIAASRVQSENWIARPDEQPSPLAAAAEAEQETADVSGVRVLCVDDQPDARNLLQTILAGRDASVKTAASAAEALAIIENWKPDVLISDIGMPIEDGYALIRKIRARPENAGGTIPAIALTAYARAEDEAQTAAAGYQMHIVKPVDPTKLTNAVAKLAREAKIF